MTRYQGPVLLDDAHHTTGFDCGNQVLNDWLTRRALRDQRQGSSRIWVATDGQKVVAFYASNTAVIARSDAPRRAARNQPDPLPAMLLGRLAVDVGHQGHGLASALLKHFLLKVLEVAARTGVRLALVHAKDEAAAAFYRHHGFEPSPIDELTLVLLVKDIRS